MCVRARAWPAQLEARRTARLGQPVGVLNGGVGGSTSAGLLATGKEALQIGAELLIVYQGHNEVAQFVQLGTWAPNLTGLRLPVAAHSSPLFPAVRRPPPTSWPFTTSYAADDLPPVVLAGVGALLTNPIYNT